MFLPIGKTFGSYTVFKQLLKTEEYCVYEMISEFGKVILACEFFPDGICARDEQTGLVAPAEGFEEEFSRRLLEFKDKLNRIKSLNLGPIVKILDTAKDEDNNLIVFYQKPELRLLKEFLAENGGRIAYRQAYELMLPLMEALDTMAAYGIFFEIKPESLYVSPFGGIEHSGLFIKGHNVNYTAEDIASVLYIMLTGSRYQDSLKKPSENGTNLPESLDNLIYNTLYSNTEYSSVREFTDKVKDAVIFDSNMVSFKPEPDKAYKLSSDIEKPEPLEYEQLNSEPDNESEAYGYTPLPESAPYHPNAKGSFPEAGPGPNRGYDYGYPAYPPPPKKNGGKLLIGCFAGGCLSLIIIMALAGYIVFQLNTAFMGSSYSSGSSGYFTATAEAYLEEEETVLGETYIMVDDRTFSAEDTPETPAEETVLNDFEYTIEGDFDKKYDILADIEAHSISIENEKENMEEGYYIQSYAIHNISTLTDEEYAAEFLENGEKNPLFYYGWKEILDQYGLLEFEIISVEFTQSWSEEALNRGPQWGDGIYSRSFIAGMDSDDENYKIYDFGMMYTAE